MSDDVARMPVGPHIGKPLSELDLEYLERCLSYDSSWSQYRPLFLQEIERRRQIEMLRHSVAPPPPIEPARVDEANATIKVTLPAWLVKRVRIDCVLRDLTLRGYIEAALKAALEPGRLPSCES